VTQRRSETQKWLWAIVALAVLLRLGAALYLGDDVVPEPGIYDQVSYDGLARRVLAGYGFSFGQPWWPATAANAPTAHWSFLYTLYVAGVYALFGPHPLAARLIQAIVAGVLLPWLTYRLGRRAFGPMVGLVAAAISAVYVYFFYYGAALMTETFYMLSILWTLDLAMGISESANQRINESTNPQIHKSANQQVGKWVLLGVAMGVATLLRQTFLPFVGLVLLWLWWASKGTARTSGSSAPSAASGSSVPSGPSGSSGLSFVRRSSFVFGPLITLAVIAALILPWTVRNYRAFGQFVLLNTNAGYAFFWANHPIYGTNFMLLPPEISYESLIPPELQGLNEAALENALMQRGLQFVLEDPGRYLLLSLNRLQDQFKFWPSPDSSRLSNLSRVGSFGVFLPFMLYGTWLAIVKSQIPNPKIANRKSKIENLQSPVFLWLGFVVFYNAMHLASWASIRYRLPTDAVMVIFAGLAIVELGTKLYAHPVCRRLPGRGAGAAARADPGAGPAGTRPDRGHVVGNQG